MEFMFAYASAFTGQGLETWNVSSLIDMEAMFAQNHVFNADITGWNVSNVEIMVNDFMDVLNDVGKLYTEVK